MPTTLSWRRGDAEAVDESGDVAAQPLLATDTGSTTVLHVRQGAGTEAATSEVGQLAVVVAGSGTVDIDEESTHLSVGDAIHLPAGCTHRFTTRDGLTVVVITYPEADRSWRVTRQVPDGRWVAGVFNETDRAREYRDRLRQRFDEHTVALE